MEKPCCGTEIEALKCQDGLCFRGDTECFGFRDHPACNAPPLASPTSCRMKKYSSTASNSQAYGGLPLHRAVLLGEPRLVEQLVQEGHDVNVHGLGGATPLHVGPFCSLSMALPHSNQ